jgi:hypothetical protein
MGPFFYPPTQAYGVGLRTDLPAPVRRLPSPERLPAGRYFVLEEGGLWSWDHGFTRGVLHFRIFFASRTGCWLPLTRMKTPWPCRRTWGSAGSL